MFAKFIDFKDGQILRMDRLERWIYRNSNIISNNYKFYNLCDLFYLPSVPNLENWTMNTVSLSAKVTIKITAMTK